jgi:hypothetical protein
MEDQIDEWNYHYYKDQIDEAPIMLQEQIKKRKDQEKDV